MNKEREKVKINGYVDKNIWTKFLEKVFKDYGKTSGGALSSSIEKALETYLKATQHVTGK